MDLKNYKFLIFILLFYSLIRIILLFFPLSVWWDSAAYIGFGKYLLSGGATGVFEYVRPIFLPFIFGIIWKIGLPVILFGRLLELVFTLGLIIFTFLLTKEIFNKKIANIASAILLFNYLIFFFGFKLYTGIPSTLFIVAALYFMLKYQKENKYSFLILSSLFGIFAFLTRYPMALIFIPLNLILIFRKQIKAFFILNFSAFIFSLPYLIYNYVKFSNPLHLFLKASAYYTEHIKTGVYSLNAYELAPTFMISKSPLIYIFTILLFFNILIPFMIYGFYKVKYNKKILSYLVIPMFLLFIYFQITALKEERYLISIFPMLAIFTAYGISHLRKYKNYLLVLFVLITLFTAVPDIYGDKIGFYENFFQNPPINQTCNFVASSDPHTALNYKTNFLYEVYNETWSPPQGMDCVFYYSCAENRQDHLEKISNYSIIYQNQGNCDYYIFKYKNI